MLVGLGGVCLRLFPHFSLSTRFPLCSGFLLLTDAISLWLSLPPSLFPSVNFYASPPSIFQSICQIFNVFVVFHSHLPRPLSFMQLVASLNLPSLVPT